MLKSYGTLFGLRNFENAAAELGRRIVCKISRRFGSPCVKLIQTNRCPGTLLKLTPKSAANSDRHSILVVDDNEDNRYTLQTLLEADGYQNIASASGGNEAISLIENEKFSLVLLDMMMPDLNGDEVLRLIRSRADTRDIPVVMISADTDTDKISKCIELGADDYLPKPFNPTILARASGPPCGAIPYAQWKPTIYPGSRSKRATPKPCCETFFLLKLHFGFETAKAILPITTTMPPFSSPTSSGSARLLRG